MAAAGAERPGRSARFRIGSVPHPERPRPPSTPHPAHGPTMTQPDIPPFESLARSYNFQTLPGRNEVFVGLLLHELARFPRPVRAADVGCGSGIGLMSSVLGPVRAAVDDFW